MRMRMATDSVGPGISRKWCGRVEISRTLLLAVVITFISGLSHGLSIGDYVSVTAAGSPLNMRQTASTSGLCWNSTSTSCGASSQKIAGQRGTVVSVAAGSGSVTQWAQMNWEGGPNGPWSAVGVSGTTYLATVPQYDLSVYRRVDGTVANNGAVVTASPPDVLGYTTFTTNPFQGGPRSYFSMYYEGTSVTLTAPSTVSGKNFSGWSDCNGNTRSSSTSYTFSMSSTTLGLCVEFVTPVTTQSLQVDSQLDGVTTAGAPVTFNPLPLNVAGSATPTTSIYPVSTASVNVTAGSWNGTQRRFTGWFASPLCTGAGANSNATCGVSMATSRAITATYATQSALSLFATVNGVGTSVPGFLRTASNIAGTPSPSTSTPSATTSLTASPTNSVMEYYDLNQYVKLTAPATSTGVSFSRWNGPNCLEGVNTGLSCTIRMSSGGNGFEAVFGSTTGASLSFAISSGQASSTAVLYSNSSCAGNSLQTRSGASGTFADLPAGSYCVEAYNANPDYLPSGASEYWGKASVSLSAGASSSLTISRTEPFVTSFQYLDALTGQVLTNAVIGQQVKLRANVANLGAARNVSVMFGYRYTESPSTIFSCQSPTVFAGSGQAVSVECLISASAAGTLQRQFVVRSDASATNPVTDSWPFSPADVLHIGVSASLTVTPIELEVNYQIQPLTAGPISTLRGQRVRLRVRVTDGSAQPVSGASVAIDRYGWLSQTPNMATVAVQGDAGAYDVFFYVPTLQDKAPLGVQQTLSVVATKGGFNAGAWTKQVLVALPPYGVTIVVHGFQLDGCQERNELVEKVASAVLQRKGKGRRYTYRHDYGRVDNFENIAQDGGNSVDGEWIFTVNWSCQSNDATPGHAEAVAQALWGTLKTFNVGGGGYDDASTGLWERVRQANRPVHFIAHSFGAAVTQQLLRRLVTPNGGPTSFEQLSDVHITTLDPHEWNQSGTPVDDAVKFPNINYDGFDAVRRDNYYQRQSVSSLAVPAGRCILGAYNVKNTFSDLEVDSVHTKVWRKYLHTILPDAELITTTAPPASDQNWLYEWSGNTEKWSLGYAYSVANGMHPPSATVCSEETYEFESNTDVQIMGPLGTQPARYPFDQYRVFDGGFSPDLDGRLSPEYFFTDRAGFRDGTAVRRSTADGVDIAFNGADAERKILTNNTYVPADVLSFRLKIKAAGVLVDQYVPAMQTNVPSFVFPGASYSYGNGVVLESRTAPLPAGDVKIGLYSPTPTSPLHSYTTLAVESGSGIYLKNTAIGSSQFCYPLPTAAQGGRLAILSVEVVNTADANGQYYVDDLELSTQACPTASLSVTVISQLDGTLSGGVNVGVTGLMNSTVVTNANTPAFVTVASVGTLTFTAPSTDSSGMTFDSWQGCDSLGATVLVCNVLLTNSAQHRGITARYRSPIVNGACGVADGSFVRVVPTSNLCLRGTASPAAGTGPWTWTCAGLGGGTMASCSAQLADTVPDPFSFAAQTGVPLNAVATSNSVTISGINTAAPISVLGGSYSIGCSSVFTAIPATVLSGQTVCLRQYSSTVESTQTRATLCVDSVCADFDVTTVATGAPVNGACGSANGIELASAPSGSSLCASGTPSPVSGSGPWSWTCIGVNGGTTSTCSASLATITYTLTVTADAGGSTSISGASQRAAGEPVSVIATAGAGSIFSGWSTNVLGCSSAATCNFNMPSSSAALNATFAVCSYSFTPSTLATLAAVGSTGSFVVTASPANCPIPYPVTTSAGNWLSANASGTTITYSATNNPSVSSRVGQVVVGNQSISVTQLGAPVTGVDGVCGAIAGTTVGVLPNQGLCSAGALSTIVGTGPWSWQCQGTGGGSTAVCGANRSSEAVPTHVEGPWLVFGTGTYDAPTRVLSLGDRIGYEFGNDVDGDGNPSNRLYVSAGAANDAELAVHRQSFAGPATMSWTGCISTTNLSYHIVGLAQVDPAFTGIAGSQHSPISSSVVYFLTRYEDPTALFLAYATDSGTNYVRVVDAALSTLLDGSSAFCGKFAISAERNNFFRASYNDTELWAGIGANYPEGTHLVPFALNFDNIVTLGDFKFAATCRRPTSAQVEGTRLLRYLAGLRGDSLVAGTLVTSQPAALVAADELALLESTRGAYDFDGDGQITPERDGVLYLRYAMGFRNSALLAGLSLGANRTPAQIQAALEACR